MHHRCHCAEADEACQEKWERDMRSWPALPEQALRSLKQPCAGWQLGSLQILSMVKSDLGAPSGHAGPASLMQYHVQVAERTCMSAGPQCCSVCAHACLNSLWTFSQGPVELSPALPSSRWMVLMVRRMKSLGSCHLLPYIDTCRLRARCTLQVHLWSQNCAMWSGMLPPIRCCCPELVGAASLRGASLQ